MVQKWIVEGTNQSLNYIVLTPVDTFFTWMEKILRISDVLLLTGRCISAVWSVAYVTEMFFGEMVGPSADQNKSVSTEKKATIIPLTRSGCYAGLIIIICRPRGM